MKLKILFSILTFSLFLAHSPAWGESTLAEMETLTGDWGGARTELEEKGLAIEFVYTGEIVSNQSGGTKTKSGQYLDNFDLTFTLDTQKAGWWNNGTLFAYILSNHGKNPTEFVGDLQTTSNIESEEYTRLYEFWYEHQFMEGRVGILLGLHDLNSEFNASDYAGLFPNSSFGIEPDISANIPVSIFPVAAPAVRVRWDAASYITILAAVYDGDPGSQSDNPNGLEIKIDESIEGLMEIIEVQFKRGESSLPGTYRFGAWQHHTDGLLMTRHHAGKFAKHLAPGETADNRGVYFVADQMVFREEGDQGLGIFVQIGRAKKEVSEVDSYFGLGFNYIGLIPSRDEDIFGAAYNNAHISDDLALSEGSARTFESVVEFTYHAQIFPWFALQPDLQIVDNPGGDPGVKTAYVYSIRSEIVF